MEAQRIVVNGRNLPVHRWIELNEEANQQNFTQHDVQPFVPQNEAG